MRGFIQCLYGVGSQFVTCVLVVYLLFACCLVVVCWSCVWRVFELSKICVCFFVHGVCVGCISFVRCLFLVCSLFECFASCCFLVVRVLFVCLFFFCVSVFRLFALRLYYVHCLLLVLFVV